MKVAESSLALSLLQPFPQAGAELTGSGSAGEPNLSKILSDELREAIRNKINFPDGSPLQGIQNLLNPRSSQAVADPDPRFPPTQKKRVEPLAPVAIRPSHPAGCAAYGDCAAVWVYSK
jgi:hypothetical protein